MPDPEGRPVQCAVVQLAASDVAHADSALDEAVAAIDTAATDGAELIVLPECTWPGYVLGSDWPERTDDLLGYPTARDKLADAARAAGAVVVVGLARPEGGDAVNEAVVIDADGRIAGRVAKRFLWDFDRRWFAAGLESPVIKTAVGRLGVMVCADGRMPEVARELAVGGAEILIDPTAWVTNGSDRASWTNPQFEHMLRTRAIENGVWAVAANKVGIERDAVAYCGRSCVVAPDGTVTAEAPTDRPGIAMATVWLHAPVFPVPRRPALYGILSRPTDDLPVTKAMAEPLTGDEAAVRVALHALRRPLEPEDTLFLEACGVRLFVSPHATGLTSGVVLEAHGANRAVAMVDGETVGQWARTHGADPPGNALGPVVDVGGLRVGVMLGADALVMETARCYMLDAVDALVWFPGDVPVVGIAASRAAENRIAVLVVPPVGLGDAQILDADGKEVATAAGGRGLVLGQVDRFASRRKEMAPGTDVVRGRQPEHYANLTR